MSVAINYSEIKAKLNSEEIKKLVSIVNIKDKAKQNLKDLSGFISIEFDSFEELPEDNTPLTVELYIDKVTHINHLFILFKEYYEIAYTADKNNANKSFHYHKQISAIDAAISISCGILYLLISKTPSYKNRNEANYIPIDDIKNCVAEQQRA